MATPPANAIDWQGNDWTPQSNEKAAHPNSRFTAPMTQQSRARSRRRERRRRADQRDHFRRPPQRYRCRWSTRRSTGTTASIWARRWLPKPPPPPPVRSGGCAAIRWRCCRSAATTSAIISCTGSTCGKRLTNPPRIFHVNWFRKDEDGKFLWPGFGENMRVLKWIIDRCERNGGAVKSPVGWLPSPHDLDLAELDIDHNAVDELLGLDHEDWQKEIAAHKEFFDSLGGIVPEELQKQREQLAARFEL